jgi:CHASE3 domain sensor protein
MLEFFSDIILLIFAMMFYIMIIALILSYIVRRRLRQQFQRIYHTGRAGQDLKKYDLVWLDPKDNNWYKING